MATEQASATSRSIWSPVDKARNQPYTPARSASRMPFRHGTSSGCSAWRFAIPNWAAFSEGSTIGRARRWPSQPRCVVSATKRERSNALSGLIPPSLPEAAARSDGRFATELRCVVSVTRRERSDALSGRVPPLAAAKRWPPRAR